MKSLSDQALLREYCEQHSESAFAELVNRHVDLVYSSALRIVRDPHLAEDVTQSVFCALAQNAKSLVRHPVIVGWLHRTTENLASNTVRQEVRRQAREDKATAMNEIVATNDAWAQIEPHLEEALGTLRDDDRNLVLLRFFQGKSAREIADLIGTAEATAQKRLNRAVEKLRAVLRSRSVSIGAATLGASLSAHAITAAPSRLAASVSSAATQSLLNHAVSTSVTEGIVMSTAHKAIVAVSIAVAVGTGIYEVQQSSERHRHASQSAKALQDLNHRFETLRAEHATALSEIENLRKNGGRLKEEAAELLRLRGEVTLLRAEAGNPKSTRQAAGIDPTETALISWLHRTDAFKQAQQRMPDKAIPELALLTEEDWLEMAKESEHVLHNAKLPTIDREVNRELLNIARHKAKNKFGLLLSRALDRYCEANTDMLPTDVNQLRPFFEDRHRHLGGSAEFVNDEMLNRYEVLQSGTFAEVPAEDVVILAEKAPADPEKDTRLVVGKHWLWSAHKDHSSYWKD